MLEKRVRLTVEFRVSFREITAETAVEMNPERDPAELRRDPRTLRDVARQGRLMRALLADEEALRGFIASAVIAEVVSNRGELLRKALKVESDEQVLRPVTESLGGDDSAFYREVRAEGVFDEQIDLLYYSTPVECLGVQLTEVSEVTEAGESATTDHS